MGKKRSKQNGVYVQVNQSSNKNAQPKDIQSLFHQKKSLKIILTYRVFHCKKFTGFPIMVILKMVDKVVVVKMDRKWDHFDFVCCG